MISTPETGVDSIAVTYALLDPVMTIARPVSAFLTALTTGLLVNVFDRKQRQESAGKSSPWKGTVLPMASVSSAAPQEDQEQADGGSRTKQRLEKTWAKLKKGMDFSFGNLLSDIGPWLLFGVILAAIITVFVSPDFIRNYLGDGIFSMLVMVALAAPLYVCATASTPIAAALALKGVSPGAAMVFLLAGPATNVATVTVVAKLLGRRAAMVYVVSIILCSLFLGLLINGMYYSMGLSIAGWVQSDPQGAHGILYTGSAVVLLVLIVRPWVREQWKKRRSGI